MHEVLTFILNKPLKINSYRPILAIQAALSSRSHHCHDIQWKLRGGLQVRAESRQQQLQPEGGLHHRLCHLHVGRHLFKQPGPLHPHQILQTHPGQVQGVLLAVCQQPGGHRPAGSPHQRLPGALCLQLSQDVGEV